MPGALAGTGGPRTWSLIRDRKGHRTYKLKHRVIVDNTLDGPYVALQTPGLYVPGAQWDVDNDFDEWAFFTQDAVVTPVQLQEGDPTLYYDVEQTATTEPVPICSEEFIEDPLLYPDKVSGGFQKMQEEATLDRNGVPLYNSAFEMLRGPQVEFDRNRGTVRIEQNVAALEYDLLTQLIDCVNDAPLWDLPARCIKFSNCTWEKKVHSNCQEYYTRVLEFETDRRTFDRDILDEGTKVLRGAWDVNKDSGTFGQFIYEAPLPDIEDPRSFIRYRDFTDVPARCILNGAGKLATNTKFGVIDNVDNEEPIRVTTTVAHALTTGDNVTIFGVLGITDANGTWTITVDTPTSFTLDGSTSAQVYISGGGWRTAAPTGPGYIRVEKYQNANLLLLGIPLEI